jgi:hypothetical protein
MAGRLFRMMPPRIIAVPRSRNIKFGNPAVSPSAAALWVAGRDI